MKYFRKFLFPVGFLYGLVVSLRNLSYKWGFQKVHRVSVPVVSVGNISVGGTGKTPMAEYLLGKLEEMGSHPAYLSRGYGRSSKGFLWVDPEAEHGRRFGDEAFQVAAKFSHLPVAVCENRVDGVRQMLQDRPGSFDVLVLDDAFQHLRIDRDLDLVMIDCNRPPWKDLMLPAGNLREPRLGLNRVDLFVFSKFRDPAQARELARRFTGDTPTAIFQLKPSNPVSFWGNAHSNPPSGTDSNRIPGGGRSGGEEPTLPEQPSKIIAFAGLGNNQFFFDQLRERYNAEIQTFGFPDHYVYRPEDLQKIVDLVPVHPKNSIIFGDALILTTEKDYFRLRGQAWLERFKEFPLFYLPARMVPLEGEEVLEACINQMINEKSINGKAD